MMNTKKCPLAGLYTNLEFNALPGFARDTIVDLEDRLANALNALKKLSDDVECYCADNVAAKGPCPVHEAKALVAARGLLEPERVLPQLPSNVEIERGDRGDVKRITVTNSGPTETGNRRGPTGTGNQIGPTNKS